MSYAALGIDCPPGGIPDPTGLFCIPSGVVTSGGGKFSCPAGSQVDPSGTMCLPIPTGTPGSTGQTTSGGITQATLPIPGGMPTQQGWQNWWATMTGQQGQPGQQQGPQGPGGNWLSPEQWQQWMSGMFGGQTSPGWPQPQPQPGGGMPDLSAWFKSLYGAIPPGTPLVTPTQPPPPKTEKRSAMSSPLLWGAVAIGAVGLGYFIYSSSKETP